MMLLNWLSREFELIAKFILTTGEAIYIYLADEGRFIGEGIMN